MKSAILRADGAILSAHQRIYDFIGTRFGYGPHTVGALTEWVLFASLVHSVLVYMSFRNPDMTTLLGALIFLLVMFVSTYLSSRAQVRNQRKSDDTHAAGQPSVSSTWSIWGKASIVAAIFLLVLAVMVFWTLVVALIVGCIARNGMPVMVPWELIADLAWMFAGSMAGLIGLMGSNYFPRCQPVGWLSSRPSSASWSAQG